MTNEEAAAVLQQYYAKLADLIIQRAYADRIVKATAGNGMTLVKPLATMGCNGGPLLCDHCGKPIVLEGGRFQGVNADTGWQQNPVDTWRSWISGGMVVQIQTNGTLRIYHGYPNGNPQYCCNQASKLDQQRCDEHKSQLTSTIRTALFTHIKQAYADMEEKDQLRLLNDVFELLYAYDPGLGRNRPDAELGTTS